MKSTILVPLACLFAIGGRAGEPSRRDLALSTIRTYEGVPVLAHGDGRSFESFLVSAEGVAYGPVVLWIGESRQRIQVDSISTANRVLGELQRSLENRSADVLQRATVGLLRKQSALGGDPSGLCLVAGSLWHRALDRVNSWADAWPLGEWVGYERDRDALKVARKTLNDPGNAPAFNYDAQTWRITWIEVDRIGGAEKVTAEGRSQPWQVQRVTREEILPEGGIPVNVIGFLTVSKIRPE